MNWAAIVWLILMVLFLLAESATVALVSAWFAAGSLVALIASFFGAPIWLQVVLCLVTSACLLALLRPLVRKYIKPRIVKTNVDAVIGTTGPVTIAIDNLAAVGQVKLGAMDWTARSSTGAPIAAGIIVRVDRIEGVKAYVTPVEIN